MTIPQWLINAFAVFGFICAWCVSAGAVGLWIGKLLNEFVQK
jgi:hypothetical protein